ncbi:hypothetical protein DK847_03150 [Aestuariivirga litoralis]|uniref:Methyltransferase FkbM domain-containing protein n=1 Tax=Aestuariivirga litoralis TaxID=2650924 RepID=A0A2W2BT00_9HYPH|nr:FkbM family methyltransferase [Aestuariivirga litoralis]PZF78807.1 hypothetical protein DK847_03150 [Aestuariivirga litoralis]
MSRATAWTKKAALGAGVMVFRTGGRDVLDAVLDLARPCDAGVPLIRIGGDGDGGYLVPDDLAGIRACFSPGVSSVSDFEADLAQRGIRSFLADHAVERPALDNALFDFEKLFIGPGAAQNAVSLADWVDRKWRDDSEMILQMDIEGSEYGVICETSRALLRRFRIMVIEFHGLDRLFDPFGQQLIHIAFRKLRQDFEVVHIHPNNCCEPAVHDGMVIPPVMEFTFLRKDRLQGKTPVTSFPHPLDRANVAGRPDIVLPRAWYGDGAD